MAVATGDALPVPLPVAPAYSFLAPIHPAEPLSGGSDSELGPSALLPKQTVSPAAPAACSARWHAVNSWHDVSMAMGIAPGAGRGGQATVGRHDIPVLAHRCCAGRQIGQRGMRGDGAPQRWAIGLLAGGEAVGPAATAGAPASAP